MRQRPRKPTLFPHTTPFRHVIHIPSQTNYRTRLANDFAAGSPADIVLLNYRRYASFAAKGVIEPLGRSDEHTSELQSRQYLVCRLLLEKKRHSRQFSSQGAT